MTTNSSVRVLGCWAMQAFGETSSFLLQFGATKILLDSGPGVCRQLYAVSEPLTEIDVIVLSHVHADHILGFPYAIFTRSVQERTAKNPVKPVHVFADPDTLRAAQILLSTCYPDRIFKIEWNIIEVDGTISLGPDLQMRTLTNDHTVPARAFRFDYEDVSVGYTSDTRPTPNLASFFANVDLLIVEAFGTTADFGALAVSQKHLLAADAGKLAADAAARRALLFHMHLPYRDPEKNAQLLAEVKEHYNGPVEVGSDLLGIVLTTSE